MRGIANLGPALLAGLLAVGFAAAVTAQEATPGPVAADLATRFPVSIHAGACDEPGEAVFTLEEAGYGLPLMSDPTAAATPAAAAPMVVGPDTANVAAVSASTISATISQLAANPHAIDVRTAADVPEGRLACGEIGGFMTGDDLVFGLGERDGSGYAGTAWLHDNGDGTTTVTVILVSGLAGVADPSAGTDGASGAGDANVLVPEAVEVSGVVIEDGTFSSEELVLTAGVPAILHVVNSDDRDYVFRIRDLVSPVSIPAGSFQTIGFTTPEATVVAAELLPAEDEEAQPLDELPIVVEEPTEVIS